MEIFQREDELNYGKNIQPDKVSIPNDREILD
jgi:hypothetical protein